MNVLKNLKKKKCFGINFLNFKSEVINKEFLFPSVNQLNVTEETLFMFAL